MREVTENTLFFFKKLFGEYVEEALDDPGFAEVFESNGPRWWDQMLEISTDLGVDFEAMLKNRGSDFTICRLKELCDQKGDHGLAHVRDSFIACENCIGNSKQNKLCIECRERRELFLLAQKHGLLKRKKRI